MTITGTWSGTLTFQFSIDGINWVQDTVINSATGGTATSTTTNATFRATIDGGRYYRVVATAWSSGTAIIGYSGGMGYGTFTATVGGSSTASDAFANPTAALQDLSFMMGYNGSTWDRVRIKAANTAATLADPAVVVSVSPNSIVPINFAAPGVIDSFGQVIAGGRISQIQIPFFQAAPASFVTVTSANGGTATQGTGTGVFSSSTNANGQITAVTPSTIAYSAHFEVFSAMTASFTTPTGGASYQRIGIYNSTDGFSFGYNGTTFGLWTRYNSVDTFIAQASWNIDVLSGSAGSKFTLNGSPTALIQTNINLYRIRFGWLGIAPIVFEVLSPDGNFVIVHQTRYPGNQTTVSVTNPNMPLTLDIKKTSGNADNLVVTCGCWVAGVSTGGSPNISGLGTITTNGAFVSFPTAGHGSLVTTITGSWSGTLSFQFTVDGINWVQDKVIDSATGANIGTTTSNSTFETGLNGFRQYRIIATAWSSGTANISYGLGVSNSLLNTTVVGTTTPSD